MVPQVRTWSTQRRLPSQGSPVALAVVGAADTGADVTVPVVLTLMVSRVQGGGVKLGQGVQAEKQPPYIWPQSLT